MMERSRLYLEEKGLAEAHDVYTANKFHFKGQVASIGDNFIERGIRKVRRDDPVIEQFLAVIPDLCGQQLTCGFLWSEKLIPHNNDYEPNVQYVRTAQPAQKSAHGRIEFYVDSTSGTNFALKVLKVKDAFHVEEVLSRLQLQHENIGDVYGVIVRCGTVHILMEHAGMPLVEERAWFSESSDRMLQLAKQGFKALNFLHVKGYVHCDFKPDNLMIVRDGNSFVLKVIDFGTCRRVRDPLPPQAHTTWQYWPPELWKARERKGSFLAEASLDVYAMALTLYFVQTGSHLMMKIPTEAMIKQPEYIKMMGLPESIPPELRFVMNHCLEVNMVRRCTAEEALVRLLDSDPIHKSNSSSKEKYLANLSSVASGQGGHQVPFINNLIAQSGSSRHQLAHVSIGNNRTPLHRDVTRGPEAVRFERKTLKIFQELKRIETQKLSSSSASFSSSSSSSPSACWKTMSGVPVMRHAVAPNLGESSKNIQPPVLTSDLTQQYGSEVEGGTYPYASLLEKIAQECKTQPSQNTQLCSTLKEVKKIPLSPAGIAQTLGNFDTTKALSSISRQKSRTKVRQKSYDRNPNTIKNLRKPKSNSESVEPKILPKVLNSTEVSEHKGTKLWPLPKPSSQEGQGSTISLLNTKEDDMDCFIDIFDPEAFQLDNEDGIADYMFDLVEKQEHEEGPESIRIDMDEMSLSGPEVSNQELESGTNYQEMGLVNKEKGSSTVASTEGLPNFDLLS